jgi:predicted polyphosphate/ATP-dependent NAD kinase
MTTRKRLGLIVNPIAGMGGSVGLKGTDRAETLAWARSLAAEPQAPKRAAAALAIIAERLRDNLIVIAAPGAMGEDVARAAGLPVETLWSAAGDETTAADTIRAAHAITNREIDLLLFAGGDGTARDISNVIGMQLPVLGIPSGVKMHSAVFATQPRAAGEIVSRFLQSADPVCCEAEVMDIDEDAFRGGAVSARLYGAMLVPVAPRLMQQVKSGSSGGDDAALAGIADDVIERMRDGALHIVGPGSTTRAIGTRLGAAKTLLGVDLYCRGELIASDVTERQILEHLDGIPAKIVVTPIGGQGFIFGRGNQQISAEVIRRAGKANIIIVATSVKIAGLKGEPFLVDTGDPDLDAALSGYGRVITGYHMETVHRIA